MDFRADGSLTYAVPSADRWQIMKLTCRVEGSVLVTDQASSPREVRTSFERQADGLLVLASAGHRSWFSKGPKRAPAV